MSKGGKRRSWRTIERDYRSVTPPAPKREPIVTVRPALPIIFRCDRLAAERAAEKGRLRQIVRETLAAERAKEQR